ncbi:kelch-like protein 2 [Gracilinanus agilis]|uniref:kelch-like protein 2 n=1 Tax=Gracilinanus agilis TaxID=191870 RepID=UPI001CFE2EBA|nr:kelch-like protein 2 [Gracilinanus agilis]
MAQNLLCDVTIVADDMEISAHRVVLAACSPYFHAMFTDVPLLIECAIPVDFLPSRRGGLGASSPLSELSESPRGEASHPGSHSQCDRDKMNPSIHDPRAFLVLLPAAGLLQLQDVKRTCCDFLESQLHPINCLGIRAFADMHACTELLNKANIYAEQHFSDVVLSEEFLNLGIEQVCSLISSDKLTIASEEKVSDAFLLMVVVGGQAPKAIRSVECYDFKEERWHQVAELPSRRCRAGMVYMAGLVFAVGGFNGSLRVRTVDSYDPIKDQWTSVANMRDRRSTLGAAVLNGLLYAVGGFDGSTGLSSVEAYNMKANEWFHVAPMNTRRSSVGVGVVGGLLYAVGGYDGASRQCLSTVECYNSATNEWSYIAEMSTRRSGAGVGVLNNLLYAVGGHDGPLVRKSVEVYDPTTNAWRQVADMNMCRRNAGVCAVNGLLYVVGGDDGSCNLASVEYYNPTTDKWTVVSSCMSTGRSYAGVTVIDKPL